MRPVFRLTAVLVLIGTLLPAKSVMAEARQQILHDGAVRHYVLRQPPAVANGTLLPLVLVLHGGAGNAEYAERMTGFTEKAKRNNFIVVYPEGSGRFKHKLLTWNAGHCCGHAMQQKTDDVGFINALLDKLIKSHPVDAKRIYVTGMSNGGMMTHRLGIELSHRITAIAPVVATVFGDERKPQWPVSALMINGMLDKSVPYLGGAPGGRFADAWDGTPAKPAAAQAAFWAETGGCDNETEQQDHGAYTVLRYRCDSRLGVESYLLKNVGHAWPGGQRGSRRGDEPSDSLNATDVIWKFFSERAKMEAE